MSIIICWMFGHNWWVGLGNRDVLYVCLRCGKIQKRIIP